MTQWKDIDGYDGVYRVSDTGEVSSFTKRKMGAVLVPWKQNKHYKVVGLRKHGQKKSFLVSRLVATAFIPNPYNKPEVNHIDGVPENNNVENLEWCTSSENKLHAYKIGLREPINKKGQRIKWREGEHSNFVKLNEKQVRVIKSMKTIPFCISQKKIAEIFGVCRSTITAIQRGVNWKYI